MATLSVPDKVPPVSEDCEQLRKAFEGVLSISFVCVTFGYVWMNIVTVYTLCEYFFFIICLDPGKILVGKCY